MNGQVCVCGKVAEYTDNLRFNRYKIDGWRCKNCGEEFYNPEKAEKILILNKLKKMKYRVKLTRVRSNLILRIPKQVSDAINLKKGGYLEFTLNNDDEIILRPATS